MKEPEPIGPVEIVMNVPVWGDLRAGILFDQTGKQYRFVTYETEIPNKRTTINYRILDIEEQLIWVDQITQE